MTRIWLPAEPIHVEVGDHSSPLYFVWRGQTYPVEAILMRWRADDAWWEERRWHEYYKLQTRSGQMMIIYHDLVTLAWFLERLYD